jgi:hypothetical protein
MFMISPNLYDRPAGVCTSWANMFLQLEHTPCEHKVVKNLNQESDSNFWNIVRILLFIDIFFDTLN